MLLPAGFLRRPFFSLCFRSSVYGANPAKFSVPSITQFHCCVISTMPIASRLKVTGVNDTFKAIDLCQVKLILSGLSSVSYLQTCALPGDLRSSSIAEDVRTTARNQKEAPVQSCTLSCASRAAQKWRLAVPGLQPAVCHGKSDILSKL